MIRHSATLLCALALGAGCSPADTLSSDQQTLATCKAVTLSGKVFYNDLREWGRFADRNYRLSSAMQGGPGESDSWFDGIDVAGYDKKNYLGMLGAKISIFEVDPIPTVGSCTPLEFQGFTNVLADGSWTWTGSVCDACNLDEDGALDNGVSIAAKIVLEYCPEAETRCFSVDDPKNNGAANHHTDPSWTTASDISTWSRWYRGAENVTPLLVRKRTTLWLGVDQFQENPGFIAGDPLDLEEQAASVFASMYDVTNRVHEAAFGGIDFDFAKNGQVKAYFPSIRNGTHSHQQNLGSGVSPFLCVSAPQDRANYLHRKPDKWIDGSEALHEYGHLVHYWAWSGFGKWWSYSFDSDGDGVLDIFDGAFEVDVPGGLFNSDGDQLNEPDEGGELDDPQREFAGNAFKEGWADFIQRFTVTGDQGHDCTGAYDTGPPDAPMFELFDYSRACPGTPCTQGRHFYKDVTMALCDFADPVGDDPMNVTLQQLVDALEDEFLNAPNEVSAAVIIANEAAPLTDQELGLCSFAESLVASGLTVQDVEDSLAATQIECNL